MIKLLQNEYNAWRQIIAEYAQKRQELEEKLHADDDALLKSAGVDPEADDLVITLPKAVIKQKEKLFNKYESDLVALDQELDELQSPIIQAGIDRAIKGKTLEAIYHDAKATIYSRTYDEMTLTEGSETAYKLFGGLLSGSVDLNIDDHILELRNHDRADLADDLQDLVERYRAGEITRTEAEPYKDFEYIEIIVPLPKKTEGLVEIKKINPATQSVVPTAKLVQDFFKGQIPHNELYPIEMPYTERNKSGKITNERVVKTFVTIDYEGLQELQIMNANNSIGLFDRTVFNAIVSLYDAGNNVITVDMIINAMRGNSLKAHPSEDQRDQVLSSVRKLSTLRMTINTDQCKDYYEGLQSLATEGSVLYTKFVKANYNNNTWDAAIQIIEAPLMFQYAKAVGQIARTDIKLLNCPIQNTKENILLQNYLYNRILSMSKSSLPNYKTILLETILTEIGITRESLTPSYFRTKKASVVKNTIKILDYWKAEGFIKKYDPVTETKGKNPSIIKFVITPS